MQVQRIVVEMVNTAGETVEMEKRSPLIIGGQNDLTKDLRAVLSRALNTWDTAPDWVLRLDMLLEGHDEPNRG